ncbi:hypothetical protein SNE40_006061 [Patella caerulea]|uniref:HAT C-terminal dimerisation domain-containing protein n=1 Tax=Patella caerulea TaxID=87958 RepID=A0AAN8K1S4_PATCE
MREGGRYWLVEIHCVLHRVELAAKDSVSTFFKDVFDLMVLIHYQFKNSGKLTRHFKQMGEINNIKTLKFKKVHGTRFVSHQVRGLQTLIHNWIILALTIEDLVRTQPNAKSTPKLNGILRKLKDFSFLSTCILYLNILSELSQLSLSLERHNVVITEVMPIINRHISSLENIKCNVEEAKQVAASHDFSIVEIESNFGTESQLQKTSSCFKKRDPEGQDTVLLSVNGIKYVSKAQSELDRLRVPAIESLINCLQKRFSSFDNRDFFKHLFWIDPANWTDLTTENEFLEWCYTYFKVPLGYQNFEVCELKSEWKDFKYTVNYFFDGVGARNMWQQIFQHRKEQFPNICKLAEIILCIGPSNGVVEAGFSHLNSMLLDRRLCLNHGSMADLLLIKINDLVWTEKEKELNNYQFCGRQILE